ncbi:unnamed protein product, partial [Amoebophrya sp. A120]
APTHAWEGSENAGPSAFINLPTLVDPGRINGQYSDKVGRNFEAKDLRDYCQFNRDLSPQEQSKCRENNVQCERNGHTRKTCMRHKETTLRNCCEWCQAQGDLCEVMAWPGNP